MLGRIQAWLAALGVALAAIAAAWFKGRSQGNADAKARQDAADNDAYRRMNDAGTDAYRIDANAVDDRLRKHTTKPHGNL